MCRKCSKASKASEALWSEVSLDHLYKVRSCNVFSSNLEIQCMSFEIGWVGVGMYQNFRNFLHSLNNHWEFQFVSIRFSRPKQFPKKKSFQLDFHPIFELSSCITIDILAKFNGTFRQCLSVFKQCHQWVPLWKHRGCRCYPTPPGIFLGSRI